MPPKCLHCSNFASPNIYFPNGDYPHKYWNLCDKCFKVECGDSDDEEED